MPLQILDTDLKRSIRESLAYALTQLRNKTQIRLVIQEFYHSLNRKHLLLNHEVAEEIAEAEKLIEYLAENWKFVSTPYFFLRVNSLEEQLIKLYHDVERKLSWTLQVPGPSSVLCKEILEQIREARDSIMREMGWTGQF